VFPFIEQITALSRKFIVYFLAIGFLTPLTAQTTGKNNMQLDQWLRLGPITTPLPAYHKDTFQLKDLLAFEPMETREWQPAPNTVLQWDRSTTFRWNPISPAPDTIRFQLPGDTHHPQIIFLATYLNARRWVKAELRVKSHHLLEAFLDGEKLGDKTSSESGKKPGELKQTLKLETGKHLLILKAVWDPGNTNSWSITPSLSVDKKFGGDALTISLSPQKVMDIHHLLDGPKVDGVSISADGKYATVTIRQTLPPTDESESYLELRRVKDGKLVQTFRGGTALSRIQWAPGGEKFAYTDTKDKKTTLWIVDLTAGTTTPILKDVEEFGSFLWSPEGSFIIYSIKEKPEEDKRGVKRLTSPRDRWEWFRTHEFLYRVNLPSGTRQRLTAGKLSTEISSVSPDGGHLLFTRTVDNYRERPYTTTVLCELNLSDLSVDTLFGSGWLNRAEWSPDGKTLLLLGSPELFGDLGKNVPEGMIANDYDTQAYLYDLASRKPSPISRDFDPSINKAVWSRSGRWIYLSATDGEYVRFYRYSIAGKRYERLDLETDVLDDFEVARNREMGVYYGSRVTYPARAFVVDLKKKTHRLLSDPAAADFKNVQFGRVERWTFTNARGDEIEGRIYYPPGFDPQKQYPCIVYYYGGTVPVTREFGGRYPKNLFAAQGYVVYVLQPSGAIGYGQKFSAYHVNDWGNMVAQEIIDGVGKFLDSHPFVDKQRVGCIGASYGGFMTMTLVTKTDMFAAAISHAGISDISSYWGEGYWGYLYSSVATANSFPWNRRDIYVDRSPLFHADKVSTPLLLLHGDADHNVPLGESDQFYVALKLLGKDVEYIRVADQDHHIINYHKRIIWQKTILAWFDKWLKNQPEWWEELYGEKEKKE